MADLSPTHQERRPPPPTQDERLMAALAWIMGAPVASIIWLTQRKRSRFVAFQALQSILFDLAIIGAFFLNFAISFTVTAVGIVIEALPVPISFALASLIKSYLPQEGPWDVVIVIVIILGVIVSIVIIGLTMMAATFLSVVLFAVFALKVVGSIVAAVRVARGKEMRMPIIVRWAERWMG